jgi:hypothetical protein
MNVQSCSLHTVTITVAEGRVVHLYLRGKEGYLELAAAIRSTDGPFKGLIMDPDWMAVNHPKGLLGLPIEGEKKSWFSAWDNADVDIEICTAAGPLLLEDPKTDWELMRAEVRHWCAHK